MLVGTCRCTRRRIAKMACKRQRTSLDGDAGVELRDRGAATELSHRVSSIESRLAAVERQVQQAAGHGTVVPPGGADPNLRSFDQVDGSWLGAADALECLPWGKHGVARAAELVFFNPGRPADQVVRVGALQDYGGPRGRLQVHGRAGWVSWPKEEVYCWMWNTALDAVQGLYHKLGGPALEQALGATRLQDARRFVAAMPSEPSARTMQMYDTDVRGRRRLLDFRTRFDQLLRARHRPLLLLDA